jgi:hypothetical protein
MDRYLTAKMYQNVVIKPDSMHLLGLVSIFLSLKYQDSTILYMKTFVEKVGHDRFPKEEIVKKEQDILKSLEFKIRSMTLADKTLT